MTRSDRGVCGRKGDGSVRERLLRHFGRSEADVVAEIERDGNRAKVFDQYQRNVKTDLKENPASSDIVWDE